MFARYGAAGSMFRVSVVLAPLSILLYSAFLPPGALFSRTPSDEYAAQTDAYLSGQLSLKQLPAPEVLSLNNPWEAGKLTGKAPRDISLYNGRYYVYYGVAPIAVFIAPVRLLSGWFPTVGLTCAVFALLGALACISLLDDIIRRYAPSMTTLARVSLWVATILGNGVLCWMAEPGMNQLAQIAAWSWTCVMVRLGWHGFIARSPRWLALASVAFGLAVASKPNALVVGLALPCFIWRGSDWRRAIAPLVLPAACIGAGLALLNFVRFGSVIEFGNHLALTPLGDTRQYAFFRAEFLAPNLVAYLTTVPALSTVSPFLVSGWRAPLGLVTLPFVWWALALLRSKGELTRLATAVGIGSVAMTVPLLFFFAHWSRYEMEFISLWTLAAAIGVVVACSTPDARVRSRVGRLAAAAAALQVVAMAAVFIETIT